MKIEFTKTIEEATGMSPEEIAQVWDKMRESPFRSVMQWELESALLRNRAAQDTALPSDVPKLQGISQGLTLALGILARKDKTLNSVKRA